MNDKERIAIQIPAEMRASLEEEANEQMTTISHVVRQIILSHLRKTSEESEGAK